jgi:hypothetical protein
MPADRSADDVAAIDAAQQQLAAAARSTLEEHLRAVAQQRIDEELAAMVAAGLQPAADAGAFEVVLTRRMSS